MEENDWCVVVVKYKSDKVKGFLVDFYGFIDGMLGVKNQHFIIRDRIDDEVVFSFRLLIDSKQNKSIQSKIRFKLKDLISEDQAAINPDENDELSKYVAWPWRGTIKERGTEKFVKFCDFLSKYSRIVFEMAKNDYFSTKERTEMAHVMSWMLGCTESGLIRTDGIRVGYYDRIEDKYQTYLKYSIPRK